MYVKIKDNKILGYATYPIDDTYKETDKEIVEGFDHKLYYKEYTQTDEYKNLIVQYKEKEKLNNLRRLREIECFSVINRGELWYNTLTSSQKTELNEWYKLWLDLPNNYNQNTKIPKKPEWIK